MTDVAASAAQPKAASDASHTPSLAHTLVVATLVQIVATASVLALTALAPTVAADLGVGAYWIGYQISAIYASGMFASAIAGTLVSRFGPVRIEQFSLACFTVGLLGLASGRIVPILLATMAIGVGYGLNNPAASQLLSRVTPHHRRNLVFSLKQSGVPLGGILASFAFPYLARALGWHMALLCGAAAPLLVFLWLTVTHRDRRDSCDPRAAFGRGILDEQTLIWRHAKLRTLSVLGFLYSAMQLSMSAFAVVTLVHDAGWSLLAAGSVAAAMQLAGAFGRVGWGIVADRLGGGLLTLALLGLISGLCCILFYWLSALPPAAQVALFVAMGCVSIGWNGVLLAEIARNAPENRVGSTTGGVLVYTFIGVIIGPSSFALLYAVFQSYGIPYLVFSLFGFAGMIMAYRTHRIQAKSPKF